MASLAFKPNLIPKIGQMEKTENGSQKLFPTLHGISFI